MSDPFSQPHMHDLQTSEFGKAVEEERVRLEARDKSSKRLSPADRAFDDPPPAVWRAERVLCGKGRSTPHRRQPAARVMDRYMRPGRRSTGPVEQLDHPTPRLVPHAIFGPFDEASPTGAV